MATLVPYHVGIIQILAEHGKCQLESSRIFILTEVDVVSSYTMKEQIGQDHKKTTGMLSWAWNMADTINFMGKNGYCKLRSTTWNDSSELPLSSNSQVSPSCRLFSLQMSTQPVMKPLNLGVHWYSTGQSLMHGSLSITTFLPCFFVLGITGSRLGSSCTKIFQNSEL